MRLKEAETVPQGLSGAGKITEDIFCQHHTKRHFLQKCTAPDS